MVAAGGAALLPPPVGARVHRPLGAAGAERPVVMAQGAADVVSAVRETRVLLAVPG